MEIVIQKHTKEEYFELEKVFNDRLEYLNGQIRSMAGTTIEHDLICNNLVELLNRCLKEKGCTLMSGNMKLYTPHCEKSYFYPDLHIYCGDIQKEKLPQGAYALKEPSVIIEVLSKSTADYDKNDKFECYRQISSLQKYIMVESQIIAEEENTEQNEESSSSKNLLKEPKVYARSIENPKRFTEQILEIEETLEILGCQIEVKDIYEFF